MAKCPTCNGTTRINDCSDTSICYDCNGTGKKHKKCSHCDYGKNPKKTINKYNNLCYYCKSYNGRIIDNGGCFITTATLQHKGTFDDNCFELQEFRRLRDTYVQENHPEFVTDYYQVAPKIVENISKLEDNAKQFSNIWKNYLKDCLSKTVENNLEDATKIYKKMVDDLKDKYLK